MVVPVDHGVSGGLDIAVHHPQCSKDDQGRAELARECPRAVAAQFSPSRCMDSRRQAHRYHQAARGPDCRQWLQSEGRGEG